MLVTAGGDYDCWDLEIRGGLFGSARLLMATEEHGGGREMVRFRVWPKWSWFVVLPAILFAGISIGSATDGAWLVSALSAILVVLILARALSETGTVIGRVSAVLRKLGAS
jgi:hypothetical protein